jgi:hypothetical protein
LEALRKPSTSDISEIEARAADDSESTSRIQPVTISRGSRALAHAYYSNRDPAVDIYVSARSRRMTLGPRTEQGPLLAERAVSLPLDCSARDIGRMVVALLSRDETATLPADATVDRHTTDEYAGVLKTCSEADLFMVGHFLGVWTKRRKDSPYRVGATQIGMQRFAVRYVARNASASRLGGEIIGLWKAVRKARWPQGSI